MQEIPLTQGKVALVDDEDYERVMAAGPWHAVLRRRDGSAWYAEHTFRTKTELGPKYKLIGMHKFLTGYERTDHKNGNGLDNRKENLRPATRAQNNWNAGKRSDSSSKYKGVYYLKRLDRYRATITVHGKRRYLGSYLTDTEAALAYDQAAKLYHGDFARGNFF